MRFRKSHFFPPVKYGRWGERKQGVMAAFQRGDRSGWRLHSDANRDITEGGLYIAEKWKDT